MCHVIVFLHDGHTTVSACSWLLHAVQCFLLVRLCEPLRPGATGSRRRGGYVDFYYLLHLGWAVAVILPIVVTEGVTRPAQPMGDSNDGSNSGLFHHCGWRNYDEGVMRNGAYKNMHLLVP